VKGDGQTKKSEMSASVQEASRQCAMSHRAKGRGPKVTHARVEWGRGRESGGGGQG